jgi:hypothetical protein
VVEVRPDVIWILFFFISSFFARYAIRALFALPFSGGAASFIFNKPSCSPAIAVLLLPGTTFRLKINWPADFVILIADGIGSWSDLFSDVFADGVLDVFFDLLGQFADLFEVEVFVVAGDVFS